MADTTAVHELEKAYRRRYPEHCERVDALARIIDPSAFPGPGYDGTGPEAREIRFDETPRMRYMQSVARSKAGEVLKYLGMGVEVDWVALLGDLAGPEGEEGGER